MGLLDKLLSMTAPIEDDDYFDGSEAPAKPEIPVVPSSSSALDFEKAFAVEESSAPAEDNYRKPAARPQNEASIFGNLGGKKPARPPFQRESGGEPQVIMFRPKSIDDSRSLVTHLEQGHSLLTSLEGVDSDTARRVLDFISGITFALHGNITPVSSMTFFITPQSAGPLLTEESDSSGFEY